MGIICVNPQVLVHGDENLHKDFKICISTAFGYEGIKSVLVVLISLKLVRDMLHLKQQTLKCYLFNLNIQF